LRAFCEPFASFFELFASLLRAFSSFFRAFSELSAKHFCSEEKLGKRSGFPSFSEQKSVPEEVASAVTV
jgi:hemerythrin